MNRRLSKLIKENYLTNNEKINNYFISLIKKNPFKFLYEYDYIFCTYYHFAFNGDSCKKNSKLVKWCSRFNYINIHNCNCSCKKYKVCRADYKCIPSLYDLCNYINYNLILNLGVLL